MSNKIKDKFIHDKMIFIRQKLSDIDVPEDVKCAISDVICMINYTPKINKLKGKQDDNK